MAGFENSVPMENLLLHIYTSVTMDTPSANKQILGPYWLISWCHKPMISSLW